MEHPAMNTYAAKLAAARRRITHGIHQAPWRQFGGFVLLLAMVAWSYEMLSVASAPPHAAALHLTAAPQPASTDATDQAPKPDPSVNAIVSFDIAPS
jgi:hypothetical protein